jgi:FixJ family two-component response regulator
MPTNPLISIVDDDRSVREGTTDLIKAMGFIANGYRDAEDFLQSDSLHATSCLIADIRMPGMTGLELHEHLVESGKLIPTILVTAFPNDRDRTRAIETGVTCYLMKPFNEDELLAWIQRALKYGEAGERGS